jgi:hypothetical protein
MENEENGGEVIVDTTEDTNETVEGNTDEAPRAEKPERTPQEKYEYHMGLAKRYAKKAGIEDTDAKKNSSKPNELDLGAIAYLNSMVGLKGKDEIALAREYIASGKSVLDLAENKFFNQDLTALREAKETANAVPKGKNRSSQAGVNDIDFAVAKYKETGELPEDFNTRNKVIDAITASEISPLFSGPSVITK